MKPQLIITHPGRAHFDEVAAISLVQAVYADTVFTVEIISKVPPEGEIPILPVLKKLGYWYSVNSKNNMGLGDPPFKFYE